LIIFDRVISTDPALREAEATIPDLPCKELIIAGLSADSVFELTFTEPKLTNPAVTAPPGIEVQTQRQRSNDKGVLTVPLKQLRGVRSRLHQV
jgi:hypothetical protein